MGYAHLNIKSLRLLKNVNMVHGLSNTQKIEVCDGCLLGKQTMKTFPVGGAWRASTCLELIHIDIVGPMQTESLRGNRYFILFTDDFSRMSWVFFIKVKSQALECFKKFKKLAKISVSAI